jgi:phospholipid/cholesterol/gamma-HCH transport system substrate-binding protein
MRRIALVLAVLTAAVATATAMATASSSTGGGTYRVRAIFDDASFAVQGEQVRVAGAPVGSIAGLGVTAGKQAAVTLEIDDARFAPFHADATCAIRPQSLIGEMYVDCNPGTAQAPALNRIAHGPGSGDYYLPVTRTNSPVDFDIVQDIYQEPIAQRLAIILNEFGTGLAARGSDLNAVIRRADPALGNTDQVLKILASQNKALAKLATDSAAVLGPLAQKRTALADFITQANTTAQASATRAADISKSIQLLPGFLRQLRPLMADLGTLADQGTPLASSLGQSAAALGREFQQLTPFANVARTSLINLGNSAQKSQASLVATIPLAKRLDQLGTQAAPTAALLDTLTASLNNTGAIGQLMAVLFNGTNAANGFDSLGHYVRDELLVSDCTGYAINPVPGCSAKFTNATSATSATRAAADTTTAKAAAASNAVLKTTAQDTGASIAKATGAPLTSLLNYLIGPGG